jgi:hypothetical protein
MNPVLRSLLLGTLLASAAAAQPPTLREADRIRLAEAFHLAESVRDSIWAGWSEVPFAVLLLTPEHEFLVRHPAPSEDFARAGYDPLLQSEVYVRPNTGRYPLSFLATFPAINGVNTVVVGPPEHTGKSSTLWVVTLLHEHFHQLQYTRPDYYPAVAALDLSGGDETGMWMLNYPFPYDSARVVAAVNAYRDALVRALGPPVEAGPPLALDDFLAARAALRQALADADFRYLSFQLWQEGVARYTEHRVAEDAATHHEPLPSFRALDDFVPYAAAADTLRHQLDEELANLDLASWKRVVFYALGAAEALLLDRARPGWQRRYFADRFYLDRYFERP